MALVDGVVRDRLQALGQGVGEAAVARDLVVGARAGGGGELVGLGAPLGLLLGERAPAAAGGLDDRAVVERERGRAIGRELGLQAAGGVAERGGEPAGRAVEPAEHVGAVAVEGVADAGRGAGEGVVGLGVRGVGLREVVRGGLAQLLRRLAGEAVGLRGGQRLVRAEPGVGGVGGALQLRGRGGLARAQVGELALALAADLLRDALADTEELGGAALDLAQLAEVVALELVDRAEPRPQLGGELLGEARGGAGERTASSRPRRAERSAGLAVFRLHS
ncbi:MAG: hypothetical protein H6708_11315 [Kofleriaceae bacterium]|nr:hypothetical protein [Kofleriaceae bacterium]